MPLHCSAISNINRIKNLKVDFGSVFLKPVIIPIIVLAKKKAVNKKFVLPKRDFVRKY